MNAYPMSATLIDGIQRFPFAAAGFIVLSKDRTSDASALISAGVSRPLKGSIGVAGTPLVIVATTSAGRLPCFHVPRPLKARSFVKGVPAPSGPWQIEQFVANSSSALTRGTAPLDVC